MHVSEGDDEALRRYLLATRDGRYPLPWDRQNVATDFLKHERRRLLEIAAWRNGFDASPSGSAQKEVELYVVPLEAGPALRAAVESMGDCALRGLSALRSSASGLLLGLFPRSDNVPRDYSFVRIRGSRRIVIADSRLGLLENVLLVEDWKYNGPESAYLGLDYEKGILSKILNENFHGDRQLSLSLQAPVFSAPYVQGGLGGVSFSSFTRKAELLDELDRTLQLLVPPEFRIRRPPAVLYNGTSFEYSDGLVFRIAERPAMTRHALSTVNTEDYSRVRDQWRKRAQFPGEYSVMAMIRASDERTPSVVKGLLLDFNRTEVTFPRDLENEMFLEDIARIRRSITEDVWLQNAAVRGLKPGFGPTQDALFGKYTELLWQDFDSRLSDHFTAELDRAILVRRLLPVDNFRRLAQSVGRMGETEALAEEHFKKARGLILDNLAGFLNSPEVINQSHRLMKRQADLRFTSVETVLADKQYRAAGDIYGALSADGIFRDLADLVGLLEWMRGKGIVIRDGLDRYRWVGLVR